MPSPAAAPAPVKPAEPFLPFTRPTIDEATIAGVADVLRSGWLSSGPQVKAFEAALSDYFGGRPVRAFNSGTCTMEIALRIAGVGPGDEVITTPLSWVATSNVILAVGARPVFVDIDPATRNIDLDRVEAAVTPRTRAILPVDLAGLPVDRDRLAAIAKTRGVRVVEDAAQSFGSTWGGRRIGSFGDFVSFSFHANKNITTSEGGCLVVNDEREAALAEQYRLQGVVRSGNDGMEVELVGGKFNMTDIAARIGLGQLPHLAEFSSRRRELVRAYFEEFDAPPVRSLGIGLPVANFKDSNWHMFQVVLPGGKAAAARGAIMEDLRAAGIGTGVHYPPIHLFALYRRMGWKEGDFPNAELAGRNILTLPLFPAMARSDVTRVVRALASALKTHRKA
jgi:dTDP-4-amino-4,6-dideoxygalactose transaminase